MLTAIGACRARAPADPSDPGDLEASFAAERALIEAADAAGAKPRDLTGVIADPLPAGPGLAAWLANARKAAGEGGGIDFLRAQVLVGLILGTLPLIPPNPDGPPDHDPHGPGRDDDGDPPGGRSAGNHPPPGASGADPPRGHPRRRPPRPETGEPPATRPAHPLPATLSQLPPVLGSPSLARSGGGPARAGPPQSPAGKVPRGRRRRRDSGTATRRPSGLLDLTISWPALNGHPSAPAALGRIGPISPAQAAHLAAVAAPDPHAQWRVILTDAEGRALAVDRVRRSGLCPHPDRPADVIGRVTVTIPASVLDEPGVGLVTDSGLRAAILRAARRAAARAGQAAAADAAAPGGCAHTTASTSYRPSPRIREYVQARDQTGRQPCCRQPAWRSDLDHITPWDRGVQTCPCNLGGLSRHSHERHGGEHGAVTTVKPLLW